MTFIRKDGENRNIARDSKLTMLRESMNNGIFRTDINNRMTGIISKDLLKGKMYLNDSVRTASLDFSDVIIMNNNAEYPVIYGLPSGVQVEMESGQHRIEILKQLKAGKIMDQWWIVTLYDDRKRNLSIFTNERIISICERCVATQRKTIPCC